MSDSFAPRRRPGSSGTGPSLQRRRALKILTALLLGTQALRARFAAAGVDEKEAFAAASLASVLKALGAAPDSSSEIELSVPDSVDNGAVVPVEVASRLPGPQEIFIISESNPFPLVAHFSIPEQTDAFIATRIKVAASCNIYAVVKTNDRFFSAVKATKVAIGGCGG